MTMNRSGKQYYFLGVFFSASRKPAAAAFILKARPPGTKNISMELGDNRLLGPPAGRARTSKKKRRTKGMSLEELIGVEGPPNQRSQGCGWQSGVARITAGYRPLAAHETAISAVGTAEGNGIDQGPRQGHSEDARSAQNEALMSSSQVNFDRQFPPIAGEASRRGTAIQSCEGSSGAVVKSPFSDRRSETGAKLNPRGETLVGCGSKSQDSTVREDLQRASIRGDSGYVTPVASTPLLLVQPPTPTNLRAPAPQLFTPGPGDYDHLRTRVHDPEASTAAAIEQDLTGSEKLEYADHDLEASAGETVGQYLTGPEYGTNSDQDSGALAGAIASQTLAGIENIAVPNLRLKASSGATTRQAGISTEEYADDAPTENMHPTLQNVRHGAFASQQNPQTRNTALGSGRLQNTTKIGNGTSWTLPTQMNGGVPRQSGVGATNHSQTSGGSQPATAMFDDSAFPVLGSISSNQPQNQSASQAIWANSRAVQQTPVQRPQQQQQHQHAANSQAPQQQQQTQPAQGQSQREKEDIYPSTSHLQSALEDNRYQSAHGQMPISRQPPTTNGDTFPPLGPHGTDGNEDRRPSIMQNAGFGVSSNANAFSLTQAQSQPRNQLPNTSSSQANNPRPSAVVDRLTSPNGMVFRTGSGGRSPMESSRRAQSGIQDHDRNNRNAIQGNHCSENTMNPLVTNFDSQFQSQQATSQTPRSQEYGGRIGDPPASARTPNQTPTSQMSAVDEFGLAGFLAIMRSDDPNVSGLARGQDLTSINLNLNSPEPLYPTFAGPWAEPGSRPLQPDFRLPECYTVDNVHRVRDKIPGFSDETLFWIFYTQPQDILQELAASELTQRNWRFHKEHQMWLTKDPSLQEPVTLGPDKENGSYIFFNQTTWEKIRLSNFDLHYQQLAPASSRPNAQ